MALAAVALVALIVLIAILTLLTSGRLRQLSLAISDQQAQLATLEERLARLEQQPQRPALPGDEAGGDETSHAAAGDAAAQLPVDQVIHTLQSRLVRDDEGLPALNGPPLMLSEVERAAAAAGQPGFPTDALDRLASYAWLVGERSLAQRLCQRAAALGAPPVDCLRLAARNALALGRVDEALALGRALSETAAAPQGRLVRALAHAIAGDLRAGAAEVDAIEDVARLTAIDRVRLARLAVALDRPPLLEACLAEMPEPPEAWSQQVARLRGIHAVWSGAYREAIAIFDHLLEGSPEDEELRTWRGAALLQSGQAEAAFEALAFAESGTERVEPQYWLALAEIGTGRHERAQARLEEAIRRDPASPPLLEALATLAMNRGRLDDAARQLRECLTSAPGRASAHFLLAIVQAKLADAAGAAESLAEAITLDARFAERARQVEVLAGLTPSPAP